MKISISLQFHFLFILTSHPSVVPPFQVSGRSFHTILRHLSLYASVFLIFIIYKPIANLGSSERMLNNSSGGVEDLRGKVEAEDPTTTRSVPNRAEPTDRPIDRCC